jgi:hypothetical protein
MKIDLAEPVVIEFNDTLKVEVILSYKGQSIDKIKGKPLFKFKGGDDFNFSLNKYIILHRHFDLLEDSYVEYIIDKDSKEILKSFKDNYSHRGHGSDKKSKEPK